MSHHYSLFPIYTIPQLHFSLNDATQWTTPYNCFDYEEFYEFIVDFFEADQTPEGKAASRELLNWWNRYVHKYKSPSLLTPLQARVSAVCCHSSSLIQICKVIVTCGPKTTTPSSAPPTRVVLVSLEYLIQRVST